MSYNISKTKSHGFGKIRNNFSFAKTKGIRNCLAHGVRLKIGSFPKKKDSALSIDRTPKTLCRRLINILKRTYLSSSINKDGETVIDSRCIDQIEKELSFSLQDTKSDNRKIIRKRITYGFWANILSNCRKMDYDECVDFLIKIYEKLDSSGFYGSMTASVEALESLHVSSEDFSKSA
tara:strand:- start:363 stop:896 length:534 start_codon:yes stop_codon:yes gene_type:complete